MIRPIPRGVTGLNILLVLLETTPALAQAHLTTVDELRRELSRGDVISIVETNGESVHGQVVRVGDTDIDVRVDRQTRPRLDITVPLSAIKSLERRRDSPRNGALIGASIGGGAVLSMFVWALAVDANEADEWAPMYLGIGALFTGIGALTGWAIDSAQSKPPFRFDAPSSGTSMNGLGPRRLRGRGLNVTVSF